MEEMFVGFINLVLKFLWQKKQLSVLSNLKVKGKNLQDFLQVSSFYTVTLLKGFTVTLF